MALKSSFGSKILSRRIEFKLTQEQAAERLSISTRWLQMLEKGLRLPGNIVMLRVLVFYKINPQDFSEEVDLK